MKLIIGGAFQGKGDYAKETYGGTVCDCRLPENKDKLDLDLSCDIIDGLEAYTRLCAEEGLEAADRLRAHEAELAGKVIICDDISQGLVPMDPLERAWREMNGRTLLYLAGIADSVERVFCGIPQKLK